MFLSKKKMRAIAAGFEIACLRAYAFTGECMTEKPIIRELALMNGMSYPSNEELIMLILGSGTRTVPIEDLSAEVMKVIAATNSTELIDELLRIDGIGLTRALTIAAALELGRRVNRTPQAVLKEPKDVLPYIQSYAMQPAEHFLCVSLNGMREVISIRVLSKGGGNMAVIRPREVFCEAIKEHASAIILCHNHPSGICFPSEEDIATTEDLHKAACMIGIALLDHVIITKNSYFSFLEHGMLSAPE